MNKMTDMKGMVVVSISALVGAVVFSFVNENFLKP